MGNENTLAITVLGVNYAPERSGIAPYTTKLATALADRGHQVQVLTSRPHYPEWRVHPGYEKSSREEHGTLVVRRLRHYIPRSPRWWKRILFEVSFGLRVLFARWGKPDLVICVSPALIATAIIALRANLGFRRPASGVIVQDLYSRGVQEAAAKGSLCGRLATWFEGHVLGSFDGVVVIHDRFKAQVSEKLGLPEHKINVIRNWNHVTPAFDCDVSAVRRSLGWGKETVVLHAGAMGVKQGLENVVAAAKHAESTNAPVRFVLLGDGSQRAALAEAAQGVSTIEFRDQVDDEDFGRTLVAADVLLINESPGLKEMAVPSKLTTYFRAGRPIVAATDEGSTTAGELSAARSGVLVAPGEPGALVDAVLDLSHDPVTARVMARRGQEYCRTHLTEEVALRKYGDWALGLRRRQSAVAAASPAIATTLATVEPLRLPTQRFASELHELAAELHVTPIADEATAV